MSAPTRLDPDTLAALEEERDFLLRSLDDLEAEHAVGDIDRDDYESLKDDYTRRAAEVIRAIEDQRAAFRSTPRVRWQQAVVWLLGLALLGGVSGLLIARSSGARTESDAISGDVRESVITRLNEAQRLFADPERWDEAVDLYTTVLDDAPSNTEALTYRAWLQYRQGGDADDALDAFREVERLDPTYPDAIVFRTIVLADVGRYVDAAAVLDGLDLETAPPEVALIVNQRGIAGEVYGEAAYPDLIAVADPSLADLGLSVDDALAAAAYLFGSDKENRSIATLKLYRAVQAADPTNVVAMTREAWLLFQTFDPDLAARAYDLVDAALAVDPDNPESLFTRASMRVADQDPAACRDLETIVGLPDVDPQFVTEAEALLASFCG